MRKMTPSIIFRIQRLFRFILKGMGKLEQEHYLFTLDRVGAVWIDLTLYCYLADAGWTPNYMGYTYKHQIYQCRRLLHHGKHQYHLRFYDDGKVTGHFEITPESDVSDHLSGVDLRTMTALEATELRKVLEVV